MKMSEIKVRLAGIFGKEFVKSANIGMDVAGAFCIGSGSNDTVELEFNHLKRLAELFETEDINVNYVKEGPDLSEVTSGDPSHFEIFIKGVGIEVEAG